MLKSKTVISHPTHLSSVRTSGQATSASFLKLEVDLHIHFFLTWKLFRIWLLALCISYKLASTSFPVEPWELLPFWGTVAWLIPAHFIHIHLQAPPTFLDTAHLPCCLILSRLKTSAFCDYHVHESGPWTNLEHNQKFAWEIADE